MRTPVLIHHNGEVFPADQLKTIHTGIVWNRQGRRRYIPYARIVDFRRYMEFLGTDNPLKAGILWDDADPMDEPTDRE